MTTTIDRTRPKIPNQRTIPPPSIREVCLVGNPARRYLHTPIKKGSKMRARE
jgi:hypothetical protein